jgi:superfamily II DNA or RNA helicase
MKLIKRTEIQKANEVYNLHIKNDHNYIVEGAVVSNCHSAKANELRDLLTGPMANIPIRWGLTGTVPKEDFEYYAIYSSIGPVINRLSASHLQDMGVLAQCHVQVMQTLDTAEYRTYHDEYKFLVEDKERIDWLGHFINEVSKTGNTLVLCDRITTGTMINNLIPDSVFINGSTKSKARKEQYDDIQDNDNKVLIATYGVAAVGINIPRIFNLILIEPGKSFVRVIQSIGRGIRKAKDKDFVQIYDICSTCKFSARQLTHRKKTYKEANYKFDIQKVQYK